MRLSLCLSLRPSFAPACLRPLLPQPCLSLCPLPQPLPQAALLLLLLPQPLPFASAFASAFALAHLIYAYLNSCVSTTLGVLPIAWIRVLRIFVLGCTNSRMVLLDLMLIPFSDIMRL